MLSQEEKVITRTVLKKMKTAPCMLYMSCMFNMSGEVIKEIAVLEELALCYQLEELSLM